MEKFSFVLLLLLISISCSQCQYIEDFSGIPGKAGVDFPTFVQPPSSGFRCDSQPVQGYFADPTSRCQSFHVCHRNKNVGTFLCPNGTLFQQKDLGCHWWHDVDCSKAESLYLPSNQRVEQAAHEVDLRNRALQMQRAGFEKLSQRGNFGYDSNRRVDGSQSPGSYTNQGFTGGSPGRYATQNTAQYNNINQGVNNFGYNHQGSRLYGGATPSPYSSQRYSPNSIPSAFSQYKGYPTTPAPLSGYSSPNIRNENINTPTSTPYNIQSSRAPFSGYNENLNKIISTPPSYIRTNPRFGDTTIGVSNAAPGNINRGGYTSPVYSSSPGQPYTTPIRQNKEFSTIPRYSTTSRPFNVPTNQGYTSPPSPSTNLRPNLPSENRNAISQPGYSSPSRPFNVPTNQGYTSPPSPSTNLRPNLPTDNRNVFSQPGYSSTSKPVNVQGYSSPTGPSTNLRPNLASDSKNVFSQPGYSSPSRPFNVPTNQGYTSPPGPSTNLRPNLPTDNRNVFSQPGYSSPSRPFNVPTNQGYTSPPSPSTNLRPNLPTDNRNVFSQSGYSSPSRPFNVPTNQGYTSPPGPSTNLRPNLPSEYRNAFSQPGYSSTSRPFNVPTNQGYTSPPSPSTNLRPNLPSENRNAISQPGYSSPSRPFNVPTNQGYTSPPSPSTNLRPNLSTDNRNVFSQPGYTSSSRPFNVQGYTSPPGNRNDFSQPGYSSTSRPSNVPTNQGYTSPAGPSTNLKPNLPSDSKNVFSQPGYSSTSKPVNVQGYSSPTGPSTNLRPNLPNDSKNIFSQPGYSSTSKPVNVQGYASPTGPSTNLRPNLPTDNRNVFSQPGYTSTSRPFNVPTNQGYTSPSGPSTNLKQNLPIDNRSPGNINLGQSQLPDSSGVGFTNLRPTTGFSTPPRQNLGFTTTPGLPSAFNTPKSQEYPSPTGPIVNLKQNQAFPSDVYSKKPVQSQNVNPPFTGISTTPSTIGPSTILNQNKGYPASNNQLIGNLKQNQAYPLTQRQGYPPTPAHFGQNLNQACIAPGFNNIGSGATPYSQGKTNPGYQYPSPPGAFSDDAIVVEAATGPRGSQGRPGVNALIDGLNSVHKAGPGLGKTSDGYHYDKPKVPFNEG